MQAEIIDNLNALAKNIKSFVEQQCEFNAKVSRRAELARIVAEATVGKMESLREPGIPSLAAPPARGVLPPQPGFPS